MTDQRDPIPICPNLCEKPEGRRPHHGKRLRPVLLGDPVEPTEEDKAACSRCRNHDVCGLPVPTRTIRYHVKDGRLVGPCWASHLHVGEVPV